MLIVCEGVDGGGKTTYVESLVRTYTTACEAKQVRPHVTVLHKGPPAPGLDPFDEYELELLRDHVRPATFPRSLVICDRWHVGEMIYGPRLRGHSRLDAGGVLHIELMLRSLGALRLLVQPASAEVITDRVEARGDDLVKVSLLKEIHGDYEDHALRYGYLRAENLTPVKALNLAAEANHRLIQQGSPVRQFTGWLGSMTPSVLLVGDVRNPRKPEDAALPYPFTPRYKGSSSAYLMRAVIRAGLDTNQLAIINANEPGTNLSALHHLLPEDCAVVALGSLASRALAKKYIRHVNIGHPQWWNRFKHAEMAEYVLRIKEATRADRS